MRSTCLPRPAAARAGARDLERWLAPTRRALNHAARSRATAGIDRARGVVGIVVSFALPHSLSPNKVSGLAMRDSSRRRRSRRVVIRSAAREQRSSTRIHSSRRGRASFSRHWRVLRIRCTLTSRAAAAAAPCAYDSDDLRGQRARGVPGACDRSASVGARARFRTTLVGLASVPRMRRRVHLRISARLFANSASARRTPRLARGQPLVPGIAVRGLEIHDVDARAPARTRVLRRRQVPAGVAVPPPLPAAC